MSRLGEERKNDRQGMDNEIYLGERFGEEVRRDSVVNCFLPQREAAFNVTFYGNSLTVDHAVRLFCVFMDEWPSHNDKLIAKFHNHAEYRKKLLSCDSFLKKVLEIKSKTAQGKVVKAILDNPEAFSFVIKNFEALKDFCDKFPDHRRDIFLKLLNDPQVKNGATIAAQNLREQIQVSLSKLGQIQEVKEANKQESDPVSRYFANEYTFRNVFFIDTIPLEAVDLFLLFMEKYQSHHDVMIKAFGRDQMYQKHLFKDEEILKKIFGMKSKSAQEKVINAILNNNFALSLLVQDPVKLAYFKANFPQYKAVFDSRNAEVQKLIQREREREIERQREEAREWLNISALIQKQMPDLFDVPVVAERKSLATDSPVFTTAKMGVFAAPAQSVGVPTSIAAPSPMDTSDDALNLDEAFQGAGHSPKFH